MSYVNLGSDDPLHRAVVISLFTWRLADGSDQLDDDERHGWWGDSFPDEADDRIGSKLWLLRRRTLTQRTVIDAINYANKALQWLVADEVVESVIVTAEREGTQRLNMKVVLTVDGSAHAIDFTDIWQVINNGV